MVTPSKPTEQSRRRHLPDSDELAFIEVTQRIRADKLNGSAPQHIDALSRTWQEPAEELHLARKESGEPGFWQSYDAMAKVIPQLADWRELVKVAPEQKAEKEDPRFTKGKNGQKVIKLASIEDIYALPDAEYLIARIIETASVSLLYGISGTGKTFTALDLALCIAHGILWHGRKVKQGVVWYVNTEGGRNLKKRLKAWYQEHPHLQESPNFKIIPWAIDLKDHFQDLLATIEDAEETPVLITVDNFSMVTPGANQNLQEEVAPVLRACSQTSQDYSIHFMLIHHTNKSGDFNGTMAFRNHVDTMIELKREDQGNRQSPIIFSSQKTRDDEPFGDIRTELKQVVLYYDDATLVPVTSCVVTDTEQPEPEKATPEIQLHMLRLLKAHVKLTCNQWQRHCEDTHQIARATFYRVRSIVERDGFVTTANEKSRGKSVYYSLTEKGEQAVD